MGLRLDLQQQHLKLEAVKIYYIQVMKIINWPKKVVQAEGLHICKRRYKMSCEEWQRQFGWGEDGKGFVWKYIMPSTAKKNKYGGSAYLSSKTDSDKSVPYWW